MSSDSITYSFCTQSIRYAYQIIGYDALIKEINFIHHLHTSQTALPSEPTAPKIALFAVFFLEKIILLLNMNKYICT